MILLSLIEISLDLDSKFVEGEANQCFLNFAPFGFPYLPDCSCGGTRRLERSRQKNDKAFRLCSSSWLAFICSWYLSNHSASASGSSA